MLKEEVLGIVSDLSLGFRMAGDLLRRGEVGEAKKWEEPAVEAMERKIAEAGLTSDEAGAVRRRLNEVKDGHGLTTHEVGQKFLTCGML